MGEHLSAVGEEVGPDQGPPGADIVPEEENKAKEVVRKPEVKAALEDPQIKLLLQMLTTDETAAQR